MSDLEYDSSLSHSERWEDHPTEAVYSAIEQSATIAALRRVLGDQSRSAQERYDAASALINLNVEVSLYYLKELAEAAGIE